MPTFEIVNAKTGEYVIRGRLNPDAFKPSSTGSSTLITSGDTQVMGPHGIRGNLNLFTKTPDLLVGGLND